MPTIELPEEPPLPGANTFYFPIQSVMLYPREEERRLHWFASAMAGSYNMWRSTGAPEDILGDFHGWISVLWELKQAPQRVFKDGIDRISRAGLSGHVLLYLLRLSKHHPLRCSLEQAKALVIQFAPRKGETVSDSLVNKAWADFKIVSHLYATLVLIVAKGQDVGMDNEYWARFLGRSERFRIAAEGARLLDAAATWKAPSWRTFPVPDEKEKIDPLGTDQIQFLEEQFPL